MFRDLIKKDEAKETEKEQPVRSEAKQERMISWKQEERLF